MKRRSPRALARLWSRVRPFRHGLYIAGIALVLASVITLAFPLVVQYLLDAAFLHHDRRLLDHIALGLIAAFAVQAVLNYIQTYFLSATGERAVASLRQELFAKLIDMPPGFFADRRTGELTSRLTIDIGLVQGVMSHQIAEFSRQLLALTGSVVMLFIMQWKLMLTTLGVVPVVIASGFFFGRRLRRMSTTVQDQVADATAVAEEAFAQIRVVQGFAQEPHERGRYGSRIGAVLHTALARARSRALFFGMLTFTAFGGVSVVLWQGGRMVLANELTPGKLVSFLLYSVTIATAIGALTSFYTAYQEALGAAERVFQLLETQPTVADPPSPKSLPRRIRGEVEFRGVWFSYRVTDVGDQTSDVSRQTSDVGDQPSAVSRQTSDVGDQPSAISRQTSDVGHQPSAISRQTSDVGERPTANSQQPSASTTKSLTLRDLSLHMRPGEVVALVGPSGAGKTTIASLLPRFWDVDAGAILLDGIDVRELALRDLRRAVGTVPQEPVLFSGSVRENIAYARPDATHEEVMHAARVAHAHEFINNLAHGYDTLVGERGVKLSGGQRQRIAIARAVLKDPAVLILDEATSSLDNESERLVEAALESLMYGRTTLIIAHRLSTVQRADRLVVLDQGRIVEEGTHAELLRQGGIYARLFQLQWRDEDLSKVLAGVQ